MQYLWGFLYFNFASLASFKFNVKYLFDDQIFMCFQVVFNALNTDYNPKCLLGSSKDDTSLHVDLKLWPSTFERKSGRQCLYCTEGIGTLLLARLPNCCSASPCQGGGRCRVVKFLQIVTQAVAYIASLASLCVLLLLDKPKASTLPCTSTWRPPLAHAALNRIEQFPGMHIMIIFYCIHK